MHLDMDGGIRIYMSLNLSMSPAMMAMNQKNM